MKEKLCSDTVHLLSKLKLKGLILSRGEDATRHRKEGVGETTPEVEIDR